MLHIETIEPRTLVILKALQANNIFSDSRLVGGTALALQIGHRKSIDIDLFGKINISSDELIALFSELGNTKMVSTSKNINIATIDGVKVDTVNYPYPWLEDAVYYDNIRLATPKDIAAMKIAAIVNRGSKKDFIDLFFLLRIYSLKEILTFYINKYPSASLFLAYKSINYFDDAESDPMPFMFENILWEDVKHLISHELKKLI